MVKRIGGIYISINEDETISIHELTKKGIEAKEKAPINYYTKPSIFSKVNLSQVLDTIICIIDETFMENEIYYCSCGNKTELTESGLCVGCEAMNIIKNGDVIDLKPTDVKESNNEKK